MLTTYVPNVSWVPTHIDLTCFNYNIVSDGTVASPQLTTRAYAWLRDSLRPATQRTYSRMFADFLAFLVVTVLTPRQVNVDIILAFLEYLVDNSLSVVNICNYLTAPRTMFKIHNLPTHPFRDEKIQMFVKSVRINRPLVVIFPEQMLLDIIAATETLEFSEFFLLIYLLAFFSVLRLSHMVPHSKNGFDPSDLSR